MRLGDVGYDVSAHELQRLAARAGALANEIERIGNLRVAKPATRLTAGLHAEVDAARSTDLHNPAMCRHATAEVDILQPAVEWQGLVKLQPPRVHHVDAYRHVAAVGVIDVLNLLCRFHPTVLLQRLERILEGEPGTENAVGDNMPGANDDIGPALEDPFDSLKIAGTRHEIVVEEDDDVKGRARPEDRITLYCQAPITRDAAKSRMSESIPDTSAGDGPQTMTASALRVCTRKCSSTRARMSGRPDVAIPTTICSVAVPPALDAPLDEETLTQTLVETRELAHARMARPVDLDEPVLGAGPDRAAAGHRHDRRSLEPAGM